MYYKMYLALKKIPFPFEYFFLKKIGNLINVLISAAINYNFIFEKI